jgi:hypothetical protein
MDRSIRKRDCGGGGEKLKEMMMGEAAYTWAAR